jgi:hypothetical protein
LNCAANFALLILQFALVPTMARLEGFEPTTYGLEVRSSIHLSYRRLAVKYTTSFSFRQGEISQLDLSSLSY